MKIFSANLNKEIVWFDDTYAVILKYLFEAQFMQKIVWTRGPVSNVTSILINFDGFIKSTGDFLSINQTENSILRWTSGTQCF